ncbi:Hypothetical protein PACV_131 [Pacmanvirus A23]|uniref:Hypothetical protein n=1 Tax=Pacmanvirus A23 TaxID=1932881 RepID=UPI000A095B34|nr:Hypothetical protein B9W72_gp130 [Pacmanvirus A23]SIP85847.1 Hypothetical protein PACV_131 [Pacmanvirus A23]
MENKHGVTQDDLETIRSIIKYHLVDRTGAHLEPWFSNEFGTYAEFLKSIRSKLDKIDELTLYDLYTIYAPFTSSMGVDAIDLADPDNPIIRLLIETECLDKVINDIETMVEIANRIRNELWQLTDERRYNMLYNQVHELRDNVRTLLSQLKEDFFDVTARNLAEKSFKLAEDYNSGFYHYGPFYPDTDFNARNEIFKLVEDEIEELKTLVAAFEKQLAKQREIEEKNTKQEALIQELRNEIRILKSVSLAETTSEKNTEKILSEITKLALWSNELARVVCMNTESTSSVRRTLDAFIMEANKNFEVTRKTEKNHQERINEVEFGFIKLNDSRIHPNL